VPGTDGRKMSKSYGNTIPRFATHEEIKKAVMSIVTDSGSGISKNVFAIHKLIRDERELMKIYEVNLGNYKVLKDILIEDLENFISPMREKRKYFEEHKDEVIKILEDGAKKAKNLVVNKMKIIRDNIGVNI